MVYTIGIMGAPKKPDIQEKDLHGFKRFKLLLPVLAKLHHKESSRDAILISGVNSGSHLF